MRERERERERTECVCVWFGVVLGVLSGSRSMLQILHVLLPLISDSLSLSSEKQHNRCLTPLARSNV